MIKNVVAAFQFLTILPVPLKTNTRNLERSLGWFPLVGAVIGVVTGFGYRGLSLLFTPAVAATLTITLYIVLTRGLHLDGYMDTIDGFFSGRERDRILQIMKEPTVGSFALLGIGVWFLLLFGALPFLRPADFVLLHTLTRFQVLLPALFFSYPRESGTGKFFVASVNKYTVGLALVVVFFIAAIVYGVDAAEREFFWVYGICLVLSVGCSLAIGLWARRKIGGVTGDVLGFSIEITQLLVILVILLAHRYLLN